MAVRLDKDSSATVQKQVNTLLKTRLNVLRHVRDEMADSQDKQKDQSNARGRSCIKRYKVGDQVLLNAKNLPTNVASVVLETNLRPRSIGPFTIVAKKSLAYKLILPRNLRTHPVFTLASLSRIGIHPRLVRRRLLRERLALSQAAAP